METKNIKKKLRLIRDSKTELLKFEFGNKWYSLSELEPYLKANNLKSYTIISNPTKH